MCCRKNVLLCFMYFLSHPLSMLGTLNLIASIPGPSILTFDVLSNSKVLGFKK